MGESVKPVRCGCGGEAEAWEFMNGRWYVKCPKCAIGQMFAYRSKAEAIEAWNRAMGNVIIYPCTTENGVYTGGCITNTNTSSPNEDFHPLLDCMIGKERTAKVIEHDVSITDTDGYKYKRSEYLCFACKKKVLGGDDYCSHCGARLEWE